MADSDGDFGPPSVKIPRLSEPAVDSPKDVIPQDLLKIYEDIDTVSESELIHISESESESESDSESSGDGNPPEVQGEEVEWSDVPNNEEGYQVYNKTPGLIAPPQKSEPIDYLLLLIDNELFDLICERTNNYASKLMKEDGNEKAHDWVELKTCELKIFVGLLLHMGHLQIPHIEDYWNKDPLFNMTCFSSHMSLNRFLMILKCLRFADDTEEDASETCKLKNLIHHFNKAMSTLYIGARDLTVDVPVTPHKGRIVMSHDPKNKGGKHGIKLYSLCDAHGVVIKCCLFGGEKGRMPVEDIVMELVSDHLFHGHSLYLVEFYTSLKLASLLKEGGTYCTGVLRSDRLPKGYDVPSLNQGQLVTKYSKGVAVCKWKDRRHTLYITSVNNNQMVNIKSQGKLKTRPKALVDHEYMINSKRTDDVFEYYPCEKLRLRCFKKFAVHLIQLMVLNAYRLFSLHADDSYSLLDFRLSIVRELLSLKRVFLTRFLGSAHHLPTRHSVNERGKALRKRCKLCYSQGRRKDTTYYCSQCPDTPALCLHPCFPRFHHSDLLTIVYK
ncbi:piggyBac transposable element-derived protein 4-like [Cimex lectularius]|uniref:PiggyBac transposable element-derived protein domain-containing protein n=1 Tax=Cimex lectularius TaxID=79782 RepID=A0A8I6S8D0_CIMLE|nr:piggyBac transposable element-derived protein 4-like [Cimex lectularius]